MSILSMVSNKINKSRHFEIIPTVNHYDARSVFYAHWSLSSNMLNNAVYVVYLKVTTLQIQTKQESRLNEFNSAVLYI